QGTAVSSLSEQPATRTASSPLAQTLRSGSRLAYRVRPRSLRFRFLHPKCVRSCTPWVGTTGQAGCLLRQSAQESSSSIPVPLCWPPCLVGSPCMCIHQLERESLLLCSCSGLPSIQTSGLS